MYNVSKNTPHSTFVHNIQKGICNKTLVHLSHHTLHVLLHYLAKLKMPFLSCFNNSCYRYISQNSFVSFTYSNVIRIIRHTLPQHASDCDLLWVLYLPAEQCVSSLESLTNWGCMHSYMWYIWVLMELEIRSVEHGICPIAEFTSPLLSCAAILAIRP